MSFSQRQKILTRLWSKHFELQKCGHTEISNYGLSFSIILLFLTIYGVGKLHCDRSNRCYLASRDIRFWSIPVTTNSSVKPPIIKLGDCNMQVSATRL